MAQREKLQLGRNAEPEVGPLVQRLVVETTVALRKGGVDVTPAMQNTLAARFECVIKAERPERAAAGPK